MAKAATQDEVPAAPAARKGGGMMTVIAAAVLASAGAGGAVYFVTGKQSHGAAGDHGEAAHAPEPAVKAPAQYLPMTPSIVVNLDDEMAMRYLQVDIELMARDPVDLEAVKLHLPRIRNTLMMLFTQQKYQDIVHREGKQALQEKALHEVQAVMKEETGKPGVEALYFTNFVMQ